MKGKAVASYPKLTKSNAWLHMRPFNICVHCYRKQKQNSRILELLKRPIIDHETYWALRHGPGSRGTARWNDRVLVSYGYTVTIRDIEEKLAPLRQRLAEAGYAMSQRTVVFGDMPAHEFIITATENMPVVSVLVQKMNEKGKLAKSNVRYE